ncbi:ATP-dependent DNA helicase PIF1 [Linum perenne]
MAICHYFGNPDLFITFTSNAQWPEITNAFIQDVGPCGEDKPSVVVRVFRMKLLHLKDDINKQRIFGRTVAVISAELPDPMIDPIGYAAATKFMLHGPCGVDFQKSPCMVDDKCKKFFPKAYTSETTIDDHGYAVYRRRMTGITAIKSGVSLDNRYVVPYNRYLIVKYQAHINIEVCHKGQLIKYLFKYITKGPDRSAVIAAAPPVDEIAQYLDCRSISSYEAVWRLLSFQIHERDPNVVRLSIHLPNQQPISYDAAQPVHSIVARPSCTNTMLTQWFLLNQRYPSARNLTYDRIPNSFVWSDQCKDWSPRKNGFALGRIPSVPAACGDVFYLRILLGKIPGALSFQHLRTVSGVVYSDYQLACQAMGLLATDNEWDSVMLEVSRWGQASIIRSVFVSLLIFCQVADPAKLLQNWWESMSEDFAYRQEQLTSAPLQQPSSPTLYNQVLHALNSILHTYSSSLGHFGLPMPTAGTSCMQATNIITAHLNYNCATEAAKSHQLHSSLNGSQLTAYAAIIESVSKNQGKFFFLHGHGGTGKTFLYNCIISKIRSEGKIVLVVASSGIAATLLPDGVTAHSRFKIPLEVDNLSTCMVKKGTEVAELLKEATLIVTLCDLMNTPLSGPQYSPFGGKTVLLGGDFRQTLPVVPKGSREDNINASLPRSYLWNFCTLLHLHINMKFLIQSKHNAIEQLITRVYPSFQQSYQSLEYIKARAIVTPTNAVVSEINNLLLDQIPGSSKKYFSADSLSTTNSNTATLQLEYPLEFLNSLSFNGVPEHILDLKPYVTVMLLRNINPAAGMCNGTRILLTHLGDYVLRGLIVGGNLEGTIVAIPRIVLDVTDTKWPFTLKRRQFPIRICYAMTINKSQGQTLDHVGLYLPKPVFSHGQLYVAVSRVRSADGLHVLIQNPQSMPEDTTRNIVYHEVLAEIPTA